MPIDKVKLFLLARNLFLTFAICGVPSAFAQQASAPATTSAPATSADAKVDASKAVEKNGVYEVGGPVLPPKVIKAPGPEYPKEAIQFHVEGECVISLIVNAKGRPEDIALVKDLGLDTGKNAVAVVKKWRFVPATLNGEPVPVRTKVSVEFFMCETKEECQQKEAALAASHSNKP